MKIKFNVITTQAKNCYCIQIGTMAMYFGNKQGWRLELFTPFHIFRFTNVESRLCVK